MFMSYILTADSWVHALPLATTEDPHSGKGNTAGLLGWGGRGEGGEGCGGMGRKPSRGWGKGGDDCD